MRILCILIGYLFGCFLTADVVARRKAGRSAFAMGTENPGTANISGLFGKKWAAVTLLGDILKTAVPCMLCSFVLFPSLGHIAILYAGIGAALGHGFPFWNRFRGGRGVAVTCAYIVLFSPLWGILAELAGFAIVIATGYLAVGALAIPTLFLIPVFWIYGPEAGLAASAGAALLYFPHRDSIQRIANKTEEKTGMSTKFLAR
jgi:glycerol-3-phosphate acyltransferase PlsY